MSKYSSDFKIKVVRFLLDNSLGAGETANHFGLDHATVRNWRSLYQYHGPDGLASRSPTNHTPAFKLSVIERMLQEGWSTRQTSAFFNISVSI